MYHGFIVIALYGHAYRTAKVRTGSLNAATVAVATVNCPAASTNNNPYCLILHPTPPHSHSATHPASSPRLTPSSMSFYLAIVSPSDSPLFETRFTTSRGQPSATHAFPSWSTFTAPNGGDLGAPAGETKIGGNMGLLMVPGGTGGKGGDGERHLMQMILHKSLDSVDEVVDSTGSL